MYRLVPWVLLCAAVVHAADWPQFRGPDSSGVSPEKGLARAWPEGGPKVLWTVELGEGFGGAAVRDGQVYVLDRVDDARDVLRCLDLATGKELWQYGYEARGAMSYNGSRSVPTVDEKYVYTVGPFGHVHCIDRATHKPAWSHHLVSEFKLTGPTSRPWLRNRPPQWGFAHHPLLCRDTVIFAPQTDEVGLVAYDKATGQKRWTSPPVGLGMFSYATPALVKLCGREQIIAMGNLHLGKDPPAVISGIDAADGTLLWKTQTWKRYNVPIPQAVPVGDDRLFFGGGYRIGCFILKVSHGDEGWKTQFVVKDNDNASPHIHAPILYDGHLYVQSFDGFHAKTHNGLTCLDLEGRLKWKTGPEQTFDSGGLLVADGLVFVMDGKTGELTLAEARPDGYRQLARAKVLDAREGQAWAPPAMSDGKLLVRDRRQMKCLDVRGQP